MTTPLRESDRIELNAYLDGEMSPAERTAFEQRLAADPALKDELESLRATVALLGMAERVPVPRSFTLDPALYGEPARRSLLDRLGLTRLSTPALAGAALVATLVFVGALMLGSGFLPVGNPTFAAPVAMQQESAITAATEAGGEVQDYTSAPAGALPAATAAPEMSADTGMAATPQPTVEEGAALSAQAPEMAASPTAAGTRSPLPTATVAGTPQLLPTSTPPPSGAADSNGAGERTFQPTTTPTEEEPPSVVAVPQPEGPTPIPEEQQAGEETVPLPTRLPYLVVALISVIVLTLVIAALLSRRPRRG